MMFWLGMANTIGAAFFAAFIIWYLIGSFSFRVIFALMFPLPWSILYYLNMESGEALSQLYLSSTLIGYYVGWFVMVIIELVKSKQSSLDQKVKQTS